MRLFGTGLPGGFRGEVPGKNPISLDLKAPDCEKIDILNTFFLSEFFQYNDDFYGDLYGDFYGDFYGIVDTFVATNFLIRTHRTPWLRAWVSQALEGFIEKIAKHFSHKKLRKLNNGSNNNNTPDSFAPRPDLEIGRKKQTSCIINNRIFQYYFFRFLYCKQTKHLQISTCLTCTNSLCRVGQANRQR